MSKIEWTEKTWNVTTGCTPCATGCKNCYARTMHPRLRAMGQPKYQHPFEEVRCHPEELEKPLHWRKPRMVFVDSMSDLFHEAVPFTFIADVFYIMCGEADTVGWHVRHTYQVLTKHPDRMREFFDWLSYQQEHDEAYIQALALRYQFDPPRNIWLGASASTQDDLDRVTPHLLMTPAAVRFLSLEPLLGAIDLKLWDPNNPKSEGQWMASVESRPGAPVGVIGMHRSTDLHWVIVGAESGPHHRPCDHNWIARITGQCEQAGVPCFVKQEWINGKLVKMPMVRGRVWDQMPEAS